MKSLRGVETEAQSITPLKDAGQRISATKRRDVYEPSNARAKTFRAVSKNSGEECSVSQK